MNNEGNWKTDYLMNHLLMENGSDKTSSSTSPSGSDMDLRPDHHQTNLYEIPPNGGPQFTESALLPNTDDKPSNSESFAELHKELEKFSKMLEMDEWEIRRKKEIIRIIKETSQLLFQSKFRHLEVHAFGGFSNGLATAHSDLDIVLTGMYSPDFCHNGGFSQFDKSQICKCLNMLLDRLDIRFEDTLLISRARIPLLKLKTEDGIDVDISLGNDSGIRAARFIKSKVDEFPSVRPLVLAIKYILKSNSLNDVATCGLGTYSIANMVIAFIQDSIQKQKDIRDYGRLFIEFLHFYGYQFYYKKMAISLRKGAFCGKHDVLDRDNRTREEDYTLFKICIEDYISGYDVSGGTMKMTQIVKLLRTAHDTLNPCEHTDNSSESYTGGKLEFPLLSKLKIIQCNFELEAFIHKKKKNDHESLSQDPQRKKKKRRLTESESVVKDTTPDLNDHAKDRPRKEKSSRRAPRSPTLSEVVATVFIKCSSSSRMEYRTRNY